MNDIPPLGEGDAVDITIRGARLFCLPDPDDEPGERYWTFAYFDGERRELVSVDLACPQVSVVAAAALPCARCGLPVPAAEATHTDCRPVVRNPRPVAS